VATTATLNNRTLFITGASRGIGLAIALRAARRTAPTSSSPPRPPSRTRSCRAPSTRPRGDREGRRQGAALRVDIRDEAQVKAAVKEDGRAFGGIDILVNNASAISLTGTLQTPMKRYDLMHQINTRGTFLCSQAACRTC
jgi:citronellol/citronellal dehydrogenase